MGSTLENVFISFGSAAFGVVLTLLLPMLLSHWQYSRRDDLLGFWESTWQDADDPNQWVIETVDVDIDSGRLRLRNANNIGGYLWQGSCELYDGHYLYGTWKSIKKGATSTGVFSFLILPQAEVLVGQAMGQDKHGVPRTSDWILARRKEDIELGKQWLAKHATYYRGDVKPGA
ncbi:hypothetical protein V466_23145 [Pseudomonas mandelii PD30]|uniref:Uncharacterized protein n=1 Tax=Pseudomonas mandelii PD30 TaxID=1419583 RepID=A0A059KXG0_9PSED|nr:hypothetical protein [Pseudomonas mandelii]KDD66742.1 hypothetical protein V466_23145 [Pseudomonas mandelii PD30]